MTPLRKRISSIEPDDRYVCQPSCGVNCLRVICDDKGEHTEIVCKDGYENDDRRLKAKLYGMRVEAGLE